MFDCVTGVYAGEGVEAVCWSVLRLFAQQLSMHRRVAITMYTEDNTENIMTEIVHRVRLLDGLPSFQANVYLQVQVHCFTPPPPQHLRIGVTGVVCT